MNATTKICILFATAILLTGNRTEAQQYYPTHSYPVQSYPVQSYPVQSYPVQQSIPVQQSYPIQQSYPTQQSTVQSSSHSPLQKVGNRFRAVGQNFVDNVTPTYVAPYGQNTTRTDGVVSALGQGAHLGTKWVDLPGHGINAAEQLFSNGSANSSAFFEGARGGSEILNPVSSTVGRGFRVIGENPQILTKRRPVTPSRVISGLNPATATVLNPRMREFRHGIMDTVADDLNGVGINVQPANQAYQRFENNIARGVDKGVNTAGQHLKKGARNVGNWSTQKVNNGKAHVQRAGNSVKDGFNKAKNGIGKWFGK